IFSEQASCVIDQRGTLNDQTFSYSMERLEILLRGRLDRYKPHSRARCGFVDRRCVNRIVLGTAHKGLHEARINQEDFSPIVLELAPPMMSAGTSFHRNSLWSDGSHCLSQLRSADLARKNSAIRRDTVQME